MNDLQGRTALVTGSTRGIGRAVAMQLAAAGCRVAVHGRSAAGAVEVALDLAQQERHAGTFLADLSDPEAVEAMIADVCNRLPAIDVLVLVAGADVLTGPPAAWSFARKLEQLLAVDVVSTMLLSRGIGQWMRAREGGTIVTIGWDQAATGMEGDSGELFAATKGAVMAFTKSLAKSLAPTVRVNCVAPGFISTDMVAAVPEEALARIKAQIPAGRLGEPHEVARVVEFLVEPESSYITGQVYSINGGLNM